MEPGAGTVEDSAERVQIIAGNVACGCREKYKIQSVIVECKSRLPEDGDVTNLHR